MVFRFFCLFFTYLSCWIENCALWNILGAIFHLFLCINVVCDTKISLTAGCINVIKSWDSISCARVQKYLKAVSKTEIEQWNVKTKATAASWSLSSSIRAFIYMIDVLCSTISFSSHNLWPPWTGTEKLTVISQDRGMKLKNMYKWELVARLTEGKRPNTAYMIWLQKLGWFVVFYRILFLFILFLFSKRVK